jgi:hypothetical protein
MFDLSSITKNLDSDMIENIAQKVGISKEQASQVSKYAVNALQYRTSKEKARGGEEKVASLLSENKNTVEDEKMKSKLNGDFVYNLTKKMNLPDGVASKIKDAGVMDKLLSQVQNGLSSAKMNNKEGVLSSLTDNEMLSGFTKKFSKLF